MAYTEFYCDFATGSNLNGGSSSGAVAYTCTNSNWDGSSVFTPTDGSTPASSVNVGDFASVYLDGATVGVYIARVTNVAAGVNGAITLSTTAKAGAAPTSGGTGRTIKVGGTWKGPNAAEDFPLDLTTLASLTNASGHCIRINIKSGTQYDITATMVPGAVGPVVVQGYTTTPGDGGRATFDGGAGTGYNMMAPAATADNWLIADLILQNNGGSGASGVIVSIPANCNGWMLWRCKFAGSRLECVSSSGDGCLVLECECTDWNKSVSANRFAITNFGGDSLSVAYCYLHDATGNVNKHGIGGTHTLHVFNTVIDTIGGDGIRVGNLRGLFVSQCDFYSCGSDGIDITNTGTELNILIQNCNFIANTGYGINGSGAGTMNGVIANCGYGTGTAANGSGASTGLKALVEIGAINYAANQTPWTDPAGGNFTIALAAAKQAGRGAFGTGLTSTVGYPDIGAAQHQSIPGGYVESSLMSGGMQRTF